MILLSCAALVALPCAYLLLLTLASADLEPKTPRARTLRFAFVVPAHNEERGIGDTVRSLLAVTWPREAFRVVVVADNCTDATAAKAEEAGAEVLVRQDDKLRGKGYALEHAFQHEKTAGADAVVVIDADTLVSANLLEAFAARLEAGARAVQADYAVRDAMGSWRTRLMAIAFGAFHIVRSRSRERFGVSCGLRGNGMCFSRALLVEVPHRAFSLVEDVEFGLRIGQAGHRVEYAGEAHVWGEMVATEQASRSQRQRWEGGRFLMARTFGPGLLVEAVRERSLLLFDLACDIVVPPLGQIVALDVLVLAVALAVRVRTGAGQGALTLAGASLAALLLYVLRGWSLSGTGARGLLDLTLAPLYLAWKLTLRLRRRGNARGDWVRTRRQGEPS